MRRRKVIVDSGFGKRGDHRFRVLSTLVALSSVVPDGAGNAPPVAVLDLRVVDDMLAAIARQLNDRE